MILDVQELVRRLRAGETDRAIARDLRIARKTAGKYRQWAEREGFLAGRLPEAHEIASRRRASTPPSNLPVPVFKAAAHRQRIEAWRTQGVEMQAIFQRLRDGHGYDGSYSSLYRYVRHLEPEAPTGFVRLEVAPGAEAQVDFGAAGLIADPLTGRTRKAWVFVMTLSYSRHQYATLVFDQSVQTWLRCHREAFEFFGGVPERIVIDNLKAAIVRAVWHDPVVQRSYREFAEHYAFLIAPCRPRTAWHKGKVESGVRYVKRNFLAGRSFRDIVEGNAQLLDWVMNVAGVRRHGTTKEAPLARFEDSEHAALQSLPEAAYDLGVWKQAKLHADCHVVVDGAYYSAPHRLIGQTLWVRSNGLAVVVFHDHERVATHRWGKPGTRRTIEAHYPPEKAAFLMATPVFCRSRAEGIGPATGELVGRLLAERPLDRLRSVQAILRLADKFGAKRLEAACRRALAFDAATYTTVKRILEQGLETEPLPEDDKAPEKRRYAFARPGSDIFP
jgi:transposase